MSDQQIFLIFTITILGLCIAQCVIKFYKSNRGKQRHMSDKLPNPSSKSKKEVKPKVKKNMSLTTQLAILSVLVLGFGGFILYRNDAITIGGGWTSKALEPYKVVSFENDITQSVDKNKHGAYMKSLGEKAGLTTAGWLVFSNVDTIQLTDTTDCSQWAEGCYIYRHRGSADGSVIITDTKIEIKTGGNDVLGIFMHELLHATYLHQSVNERQKLYRELLKTYQDNKAYFDLRLTDYDLSIEHEMVDELYAFAGTEINALSQYLSDHYDKYFNRRNFVNPSIFTGEPNPNNQTPNISSDSDALLVELLREQMEQNRLLENLEDELERQSRADGLGTARGAVHRRLDRQELMERFNQGRDY